MATIHFAETKAINVPLCYDTNPHNIPFALLRLCCLVAKAVENLHVNDATSGTVSCVPTPSGDQPKVTGPHYNHDNVIRSVTHNIIPVIS